MTGCPYLRGLFMRPLSVLPVFTVVGLDWMVCVQRRNKKLKKVSNLSELVNLVGKDTVDKCFTEYMMLMVAKANKFDKLEQAIEDIDNAHASISIPMQEDDIEYLKEFNITVGGILNNYFNEV